MAAHTNHDNQALRLAVMTGLALWVSQYTGPLFSPDGEINYWTALVYFLIALGGFNLLVELFCLLEGLLAFLSTRETTGKDGTAHWAKFRDVKSVINKNQSGPFWGVMK